MTWIIRRLARLVLRCVDIVYHWRHQSESVGDMLLISPSVHAGPDRTFADGTTIHEGDPIGAIHFDNRVTSNLDDRSSRAAALHFMKLLISSLSALAKKSVEDPMYARYRVYCGITWLPAHGEKMGFETEPLPEGDRKRFLMRFFRVLVWIVAPAAETRDAAKLEPITFWMTRNKLQALYLDDGAIAGRRQG